MRTYAPKITNSVESATSVATGVDTGRLKAGDSVVIGNGRYALVYCEATPGMANMEVRPVFRSFAI